MTPLQQAREALVGVIAVADRKTVEFDAAKAAIVAIDQALAAPAPPADQVEAEIACAIYRKFFPVDLEAGPDEFVEYFRKQSVKSRPEWDENLHRAFSYARAAIAAMQPDKYVAANAESIRRFERNAALEEAAKLVDSMPITAPLKAPSDWVAVGDAIEFARTRFAAAIRALKDGT